MDEITVKKILQYTIIEKIGEGDHGTVYKAYDTGLDRVVALKVINRALSEDSLFKGQFMYKIRQIKEINHPNLCRYYDIQEVDKRLVVIIEYIDGKPLSELPDCNQINENFFFSIASQIVTGLAEAHQNRIVHGNLRPSNIILGEDGIVRITDFSLNQPRDLINENDPDLDPMPIYYLAPELLLGEIQSSNSDIFALGCIFYQILVGHLPFSGATGGMVMNSILYDKPNIEILRSKGIHGDTILLLEKMLYKKKADRFHNAMELKASLDAIIEFENSYHNHKFIKTCGNASRKNIMISVLVVLVLILWIIISTLYK